VANSGGNTVSVLLNTTAPGATTASFRPQQTFASGNAPVSVTATDINGDGKPDLIVANNSDPTISVLFNTTTSGATTPSFTPQQIVAAPARAVLGDGDRHQRDGKPDLIVANRADNTISVLLNTTAPSTTARFGPRTLPAVNRRPTSCGRRVSQRLVAGAEWIRTLGPADLAGSRGILRISLLCQRTQANSGR